MTWSGFYGHFCRSIFVSWLPPKIKCKNSFTSNTQQHTHQKQRESHDGPVFICRRSDSIEEAPSTDVNPRSRTCKAMKPSCLLLGPKNRLDLTYEDYVYWRAPACTMARWFSRTLLLFLPRNNIQCNDAETIRCHLGSIWAGALNHNDVIGVICCCHGEHKRKNYSKSTKEKEAAMTSIAWPPASRKAGRRRRPSNA